MKSVFTNNNKDFTKYYKRKQSRKNIIARRANRTEELLKEIKKKLDFFLDFDISL